MSIFNATRIVPNQFSLDYINFITIEIFISIVFNKFIYPAEMCSSSHCSVSLLTFYIL